jgi:hypothetical protein
MKNILMLLLVLTAACGAPQAEGPTHRWPVEETLLKWTRATKCLAKDWDLRIETFSMPQTYGRTMRADTSSGPMRSTTLYTGDMQGDPVLFEKVLLHELVHVHSPATKCDHTEGLMANRIDVTGDLTGEAISTARAWCELNAEAVTFFGGEHPLLASN